MKLLPKLAFILVIGTGFVLAQTGATGQNPVSTPPTLPSGQQPPGTQTTNPDQSPMGQTGTTSTTAIAKAQSDIQTALRKQLPASADSVTVGLSDDNKLQLTGTVNSDIEKQQVEQIARSAAPGQTIVNKLTVSGSPTPQNPPPATRPPEQSATEKTRQSVPPMGSSFVQSSQSGSMGQGSSGNQNPTSTQNPGNPPSSTGAQSGTTNPGSAAGNMNASGAADVQSKVQQALQQDPSLANANITVNVTGNNKLELAGTVANKDQKKAARSIAESNAAGFKVVDHLKVEQSKESNPSAPPKY